MREMVADTLKSTYSCNIHVQLLRNKSENTIETQKQAPCPFYLRGEAEGHLFRRRLLFLSLVSGVVVQREGIIHSTLFFLMNGAES